MLKFLKPSPLKIVLALALFTGLTRLWNFIGNLYTMDTSYHGLPLTFFITWGPCQAGQDCSEFNTLYFLLDLVFWYAATAFMVDRFPRKR